MPPCDQACDMATRMMQVVSILVLMDAALRLNFSTVKQTYSNCFNPCFDGCRPATPTVHIILCAVIQVSILVLMDAALRRCVGIVVLTELCVSILVLMDAALRRKLARRKD